MLYLLLNTQLIKLLSPDILKAKCAIPFFSDFTSNIVTAVTELLLHSNNRI